MRAWIYLDQHVMGRHLGGVGLEADNVEGVLGVHPDGGAQVGLSQGWRHLGHQQGEFPHCSSHILQHMFGTTSCK